MNLSDLGKTALRVDLKLDNVTLPSFYMIGLYLEAYGLRQGLINESMEDFLAIEH
jgi:hypothetical protein